MDIDRSSGPAAAALTGPPVFASGWGDTSASRTARARWIAEQHFVYEQTNDADTILLSMKSTDPLATVVLLPDAEAPGGQRLVHITTIADQRRFYVDNRSNRHVVDVCISTSMGGEWYGMVSGVLTHRALDSGAISWSRFVGLLPACEDEDTFLGEIGFGAPLTDVPAADSMRIRKRGVHAQAERLAALDSGDLRRLADVYAPDAIVVERRYPGAGQVVLRGRDEIGDFYAERLRFLDSPRVGYASTWVDDWASFSEIVWQGSADGQPCEIRTADVSTAVDEHGRVVAQIGYGNSPTAPR